MKRPGFAAFVTVAFATAAFTTVTLLAVAGCAKMSATQQSAANGDSALTPSPSTTQAPVAPGFVNRVWQVIDSTDVKTGMMYAFLSDGTLVMTSPNGKPSLGEWKLSPSGLTMVEESIPYETEIVALTPTEMRLRSHNPGGVAEIHLAPADSPPYTP